MRIVSKVFYYIRYRLGWFHTLQNFPKGESKDSVLKLDVYSKKTVALIPHADDEIIGLGTLLSNDKSIELVYFGYLGTNYTDENYKVRINEFKEYCSFSNIKYSIYDSNSIEKIKDAKIILLPSLVDWHEEHRKLNFLLKDICSAHGLHPQIVWYNISVYCSVTNKVRYIFQERKEQRKKYRDFKRIYVSQNSLPILRFKIKERLYGREVNRYSAEKFLYFNFDEWLMVVDRFEKNHFEDGFTEIKKNLNDLQKVDKISKRIYCSILG